MNNIDAYVKDYILKEQSILSQLNIPEISIAVDVLHKAIQNGKTIYCFGNGGSAATASHFANDFNKSINAPLGNKFNFICLNDNIATLMAIANDISYDEVFKFQLENRIKKDDIIIAISGSGNSTNVIRAVYYAKKHGAIIIGLTGFDGGLLNQLSDIHLHVPVDDMRMTEDIHLMFNHLLVSVLSKFLP